MDSKFKNYNYTMNKSSRKSSMQPQYDYKPKKMPNINPNQSFKLDQTKTNFKFDQASKFKTKCMADISDTTKLGYLNPIKFPKIKDKEKHKTLNPNQT